MTEQTILVVDDDIPLTKTLEKILRGAKYLPIVANTAEDGVQLALSRQPDLVLLDVMIPTMGGWEACRKLREHMTVPIIFLTAMGATESVVKGLEMGADDYIVKPFEPSVILARIKAHLRRVQIAPKKTQKFVFDGGDLQVDLSARSVLCLGEFVELTRREFDLMVVFVKNPGRVLTTMELIRLAWGIDDLGASENIKPYIHYLRKKIEPVPTSPRWIKTVRGIGYRFIDM